MSEIFGPVPSRRLGQSLGVNNIPPKHCTYACVYCQLGKALHFTVKRQEFYSPYALASAVQHRLETLRESNQGLDYITIVPDGEPTLDINLHTLIRELKKMGVPIAIISNGSLIWQEEVQQALMDVDWVSLKVDAVTDDVWRRVDRPHGSLVHKDILEGMQQFSKNYLENKHHKLMTESMLIEDVNNQEDEIQRMADFIATLHATASYISIPTRPPAESWVRAAGEESIVQAYSIYQSKIPHVEYLVGYEGNAFSNSGHSREDLLSITAVHPMREDAVQELLARNGDDFSVVEGLVNEHLITNISYNGLRYFLRNFSRHRESNEH